jgi:hypothetical protein
MHSFIVGVFVFAAWIILFGVADSLMMNLMNRELARKNSYSGLSVVARIVIIVFTSYLNATMVEMQVFKPEITKSIYDYRQDELRKLVKETDMRVDSLKNSQTANQKMTDEKSLPYITWLNDEQAKIDAQKATIQKRRSDLVQEVEGSAGSGKRGDGDVAKAKREALDQEEKVLNDQIAAFEAAKQNRPEYLAMKSETAIQDVANKRIDERIVEEKQKLKDRRADILAMRNDGFLDRYKALGRIGSGGNVLVYIVGFFFFFLECLILIYKTFMMGRDEYHDVLQAHLNKVFKDNIQAKIEEGERAISEHEAALAAILYQRTQRRLTDEVLLNEAELALYPMEKKRIEDQFRHATDITGLIDASTQEQSVKSFFKFNWAKKFFKLQPEQVN